MNWRKFWLDAGAALALVAIFEAILAQRGLRQDTRVWLFALVLLPLITGWAAQKVSWAGAAIGGWLFPLIFMLGLYLSFVGPTSLAVHDLYAATLSRLQYSYAVDQVAAERFKDAYDVLATAAFTLIGLFFIVLRLRDFSPRNASRLISTSEVFAVVFLLSISALVFRDEPWWRLFIIVVLNGTTLLVLLNLPEPYIVDFKDDPPVIIYYWNRWDRTRRGWAIWAALGLTLIPVAPVFGESLFLLSLIYLLYLGTHAAVFLYVTTELRVAELDDTVRGLFRIRIPARELAEIQKWKAPFIGRGLSLPGVDQVPFVPLQIPSQQPPVPPPNPPPGP